MNNENANKVISKEKVIGGKKKETIGDIYPYAWGCIIYLRTKLYSESIKGVSY